MKKVSQGFTNAFAPQTLYVYGTYKTDGTPNFGLFCWATYCWDEEMRFVACLCEDKLTRDRIRESGIFSASVVSEAMLKGADWCGNHPGYDTDKSSALPSHPGEKLHVPIPDDSPWSYELRVVKTLPLDEHGGAEIYICEFVNTLVDERLQDESLSFEEKMAIAAPVCTANWQYFKAVGPSLGGWGAFKDMIFKHQ